jgi:hypothetical protein
VTNALILGTLQSRALRLSVGVKMEGVPLAAVLSGVMLPRSRRASWRVAILSPALRPTLVLLASRRPRGIEHVRGTARASTEARRRWTGLEACALFLGAVTAGVNGYLPLDAIEELDGSPVPGRLAAFALAGTLARFDWAVVV